jgi:adenylate cyclase
MATVEAEVLRMTTPEQFSENSLDDYKLPHAIAGQFQYSFSSVPSINFWTQRSGALSRAFLASALGHLGRSKEAREVWRELKEINPRYSYVDHVGRLPFRDPADAEKFTDGLRKTDLAKSG